MNGLECTWTPDLAVLGARTIRMLAVDAIGQARSGHPGAPLGAADVAFTLWSRHLRFDPTAPDWPDRDRFVLSAGHASMLLYSLLHLFGYDLSLDEIRRFRQWGSRTAGHPERGLAPGVEVTTGPLGQGFAHAVGIALAGRMLASRFNRPDDEFAPVTHRVFVLCGDGDLMEGVSYEAAALAGHLGLGNLIALYDSNGITIEGRTDLAWTEDVYYRFAAAGWVIRECDGHDPVAVNECLDDTLKDREDKPRLVIAYTEIAHGSPTLHGSHRAHGAPLPPEEVRAMKEACGWPLEPPFFIPQEVREFCGQVASAGHERRLAWERSFAQYRARHPKLAAEWDVRLASTPPQDLFDRLFAAARTAAGKATRVQSGKVIQAAAQVVPGLVGGSADLAPSTETEIRGAAHVIPAAGRARFAGRNLHFGIREHAMAAITNGLALSGGLRPYAGTFLVFADYMKPALRLAAMMETPSIFVFTHDSIGVGEDGPTHQPIEQLWMLRSIPGMTVWRPSTPLEVAVAWEDALKRRSGPTAIVLSRQDVPEVPLQSGIGADDVRRGGYVMFEPSRPPQFAIAATGSEVFAASSAAQILEAEGLLARVVSLPCLEQFESQPEEYRERVLPRSLPVVTVEAGSTIGWHRYTGRDGLAIGIDRFGASAPAKDLFREFGFTAEAIASRIRNWWQRR